MAPAPTGSPPPSMTMGTVVVTALAARANRSVPPHDHVRFEANHLGNDVAESLGPPLGRPTLQDEVLPFHIAEGPQALHERSDVGTDRLGPGHLRERGPDRDEADAVDLPGLLRAGGKRRGEEGARQSAEKDPSRGHWFTSTSGAKPPDLSLRGRSGQGTLVR